MARAGLKKGRRPPRVVAVATKRGGMCQGEKCEGIVCGICFAGVGVVHVSRLVL